VIFEFNFLGYSTASCKFKQLDRKKAARLVKTSLVPNKRSQIKFPSKILASATIDTFSLNSKTLFPYPVLECA